MKHKIFNIVLLCFAIPALVLADYTDHRNRKVDSLESVLSSGQELTDDELVAAYKDLMWGYLQTDGKRATEYANRARDLSKKKGYLNSEADALRIDRKSVV